MGFNNQLKSSLRRRPAPGIPKGPQDSTLRRSNGSTFPRNLFITLTTSCFALIPVPATADVSSAITIESEWAYGTKAEKTQKFETTIKPEIELNVTENTRLTAIGRLRADSEKRLDSNDSTNRELREFYIESSIGPSYLTVGKQQIVWGKADGLKVLDVVNPQQWREFILDDFDESRIPLWSINSEIPIDDVTLQLLWIPDQTYHEFSTDGDLYQFTSPQLVPIPPAGVKVIRQPEVLPGSTIHDADSGLRLSTFWHGWDLTLNYLYHYGDRAVMYRELAMSPSGPVATITPRYERTHLTGATFSSAFGDLTVRGEIGYSSDRYISTNDLSDSDGVVNSGELAYVIGLDWFGLSDTLISGQLFQSYLDDHKHDMIRDETETTVTLLLRRDFLNETVTSELLLLHNLDLDDGVARPKIDYQLNDAITLSAGADLFYGDAAGLFGQFDRNDRVTTAIELSF